MKYNEYDFVKNIKTKDVGGIIWYEFDKLIKEAIVDETVEIGQSVYRAIDLYKNTKITYKVIEINKEEKYCSMSSDAYPYPKISFFSELCKKYVPEKKVHKIKVPKNKIKKRK